jgi:hypothetical protein
LLLVEFGRGGAGEFHRIAPRLGGSFPPRLLVAAAEGAGAEQDTGTDKHQD